MDNAKMKIAYVITSRNGKNFWNRCGVAFVNNIPVFIASDELPGPAFYDLYSAGRGTRMLPDLLS